MSNRKADGVLFGLRHLAEAQAAELTDGQLLNRFATDRDERAFTALLHRHSALVYGVCRNILRHEQDAEDAFQGTFLVLARRAGVIREQRALGSWLYRVAYRVAMKARAAGDRRRKRETQAAKSAEDRPVGSVGDLAWRELQAMLDEELNRLPDKYRAPFVLCCLTGKSKAEAAVELGWKEGTVSSRLAAARERLQKRLTRRGVTLSAVLSGLAISQPGASALVPAALLTATRQAALAFAAGGRLAAGVVSAPAALARSVLRGMTVARLKLPAALVIAAGLAGAAAVLALDRPADSPAQVARAPLDPPVELAPATASTPSVDGLRELLVRGRVVGADGKAIPGADVAIVAHEVRPPGVRAYHVTGGRRVVAAGKSGPEGRFQFVTPRPVVGLVQNYFCLANGTGHTVEWRSLQTLVELPEFELRLKAGQQVRGRLVDAAGAPAAGVRLRVGGFAGPEQKAPPTFYDGEFVAPSWPAPQVTGPDGSFAFDGMPPRATVHLELRDERFGPQWVAVKTGQDGVADAGTVNLAAPRLLRGRVVAEDTGQPVAGVAVSVSSYDKSNPTLAGTGGETDAEGRFTIQPYPGPALGIVAAGPPGSPYLATRTDTDWPAGSSRHEVEIRLQRGVVVRGVVVEDGSGRPVPGARVKYRPMSGRNRNGDRGNLLVLWEWLDAASDTDGKFEIPVLKGPGHLLVRGPGHDWLHLDVGDDELISGKKGGNRRHFPDALVALDVKADNALAPVLATLRRGVTLKGRVHRADGTPVADGFLLSRTFLGPGFEEHSECLPVRDGRFEIPGCDPTRSDSYWFWDHKAKQGAVVELSPDESQPIVRLAPLGFASFRFVDAKGEVVHDPGPYAYHLYLVVRPGRSRWAFADKDTPARLTQNVNFQGLQTDPATGVITAKALIPGATYVVETSAGYSSPPFSVAAGQHVRLPDVLVDPPPKPKPR